MASHTTSQAAGHPATNASAEEAAITAAREAYDKLHTMAGRKKKKSFQVLLESAITVEAMMDCLQKAVDSHKKQTSSKLLAHLQKHSEWLRSLFAVIDDVVKVNTAIPCSIWAPLLLCLQVSDYHSIITEQVVIMIDIIHQTMGRIAIYKQSSPNPALYTALVSVFTDVVNFCYLALDFFNHSVFIRLFKLVVRPAKKKFQGVIDNLRRHTEHLDFMANAVEHMETKKFREEAQVESRLEKWIRALDSPNMRQRKEDMVKDQVEGTCDWILSHEDFQAWKNGKNTRERLLCVSGKSGCGKSFLAASVIEHLAMEAQSNSVIYLFFSEKGNKHRVPGDTLARSALSQILQDLQGFDDGTELASVLDEMCKLGDPTTKDLWKTVLKAMEGSQKSVFWVIDGLDECLDGLSPLDDERKLDDAIKRLLGYLEELISAHASSRVMILGRPHAVNAITEDTFPHLSIAIDDNMIVEDLSKYILAKTKESSFLRQETQNGLLENISNTLLEKSQGTFLWVRLVMNDIQTWASSDEVDSALSTLPNGLKARYSQMVQRLEKSKAYDIEVVNQVFGFLTTAGRPLDVEELRYSQGMARWIGKKGKGKATLEECLIYEPEKKFLDICGGFVHVQNGKVIFVHLSAKEYLLEFAAETRFKVDLFASHQLFGDVCMDYLILHGDSIIQHEGRSISHTTTANLPPLMAYATRHLIHHMARSGALEANKQQRILLFMHTNGFTIWLDILLDLCFDFGFLHGMEEDLTSLVGSLNLENLKDLRQGAWATTISEIRQKLQSRGQGSNAGVAQSQNLELFGSIIEALLAEDSTGDEDTLTLSSAIPVPNIDFDQIAALLEKNNALPIAPTLAALKPLRALYPLRSVPQALEKMFDPLKRLCQLIVGSSATIPTIVLIGIGFLYLDLGRDDEALPIIMSAKNRLREDNGLFKYLVGVALVRLGKPEEAEPLLQYALSSLDPAMRVAEHRRFRFYWLGLCHFDQYDDDKAEDMFRRGMSQGKSRSSHVTLLNASKLANMLFLKRLYQDAAQLYTWSAAELSKRPKKMTRARYDVGLSAGIAWFFSGNYTLAEKTLRNHLDFIQRTLKGVTREESGTRVWLGRALKLQVKYVEAESILRPVVLQLKNLGLLMPPSDRLLESPSTESAEEIDYVESSEESSTYVREATTSGEGYRGDDGEEGDAVDSFMDQDQDDTSQYDSPNTSGHGVTNSCLYDADFLYDYDEDGYQICCDYKNIGEELRREGQTALSKEVFDLLEIDAGGRTGADLQSKW